MRIPTNSNFSKEIAKKFKQIFHRDMTLGGLQDLQDESYMGSHVDNFLKEVLKKENDNGQKTSKVARTVRQVHNERTRLVKEAVSNQGKKKSSGLEITSS
jgi:bacterioferritin (cytochrome b1)